MESASSCGPQANSHPPPPRAQAPKPTGVILRSEFPSFRVSIRNPLGKTRGANFPRDEYDYFAIVKLDEDSAKKLDTSQKREKESRKHLLGDESGVERDGFAVGTCEVSWLVA